MTAPRLEIRLDRIAHNARSLVDRLSARGLSLTAVTKATLGLPQVAAVLAAAGVSGIGEPRIETLRALRRSGVTLPLTLIRSPMPSQVAEVVAQADISLNTEPAVMALLSAEAIAQDHRHGVVLMVELGDLREGIMPEHLEGIAGGLLRLPGLDLIGIGANMACQNGVVPSRASMAELSMLATGLEAAFGIVLPIVSGGNSANLTWLFAGGAVGRINNLRLGEAILLGREPLQRQPIPGLRTDAFRLVAEVIESNRKPTLPWGRSRQGAFGPPPARVDRGERWRVLLALGLQDVDAAGLTLPPGMTLLGASSDHLVLDTGSMAVAVGTELGFELNYSALLRAMTSPFVARSLIEPRAGARQDSCSNPRGILA
ncbi:alanine/ornithine racemase family PLP-dependent enzyme [Synechococcus sp. BSF8S]|uniref:alanine/ornithine racemase family PLP-dependent enzyme n=1 Tax=Synechococcales TaxID=1890424 RepID=UPI001624E3DA|nr:MULTISPECIES: alanine/ornithine racemase family PLP-dependent enzyme [unclassified Synechococcus]MBC1261705.1 alanine/ornithine racemase family PLP-dependent enzyme [Synechococcus sp. BSF8S]MBC1264634.1 alanine/ornithine racemase family PLP-dependent enzyme [Synechococcus sp. BSA11S]